MDVRNSDGHSDAAKCVWDETDSRIRNEYYNFDNGGTFGGITQPSYNDEAQKEMSAFFNGKDISKVTAEEARAFLKPVDELDDDIIGRMNKAVQAKADAV